MENILDIEKVKPLLHENFNFTFMGNTIISKKAYNTEGWIDQWNGEIIPALLPNGIDLFIEDVISDEQGTAILLKGDAEGINGEYDNDYVFVFKFKDNKIISLVEYNSDLLVATRLYKNKLVSTDPASIEDPNEFVNQFLIYFNNQDTSNIEKVTSSPFYFNDEKYIKYTDAFNFEGLINNGWSYSSIIDVKTLFNNGHAALISFDFARHNSEDETYLKSRVYYMLTVEEGRWILNGGYTPNPLPMGN
tara:strand:- start:163 stop:906 length:744 start_codon:yes stop_codon:yes gene_type:complete